MMSFLAVAGMALCMPGVSAAELPTSQKPPLLPVTARGDVAVRWRSGGMSVLLLSGHAEVARGTSRLEADSVLMWIDEGASARLGKVVMSVYAEGHVRTLERGMRVDAPRVFFHWVASELTVDDPDGFIEVRAAPVSTPLVARAESVRAAGAVPVEESRLPPKDRPPVGTLPGAKPSGSTVVEPSRIGLIYGQQQEGPDIKSFIKGDYRVTVATRYPDIVFHDPGSDVGRLEILAENMVIWVNEKKLKEGRPLPDAELQIYAEGHVVVYLERKTIRCEQLFYDLRSHKGLIIGGPGGRAAIKTFVMDGKVPFYYRAKEFRQVSADRYQAKDAVLTTCEFPYPDWGFYCREMALTASVRTVTDSEGRTTKEEVSERVDVWGTVPRIGRVPIGYWRHFSQDLTNEHRFLKSIRVGSSSRYGFNVRTVWDLYDLGIYRNDWSELNLLFDYFSKRGAGVGLEFKYKRPTVWGETLAYTIDDSGTDKNGLPPPDSRRSRIKWRQRLTLSDHWRLDAELSWLSDSQFLNEYWEQEFKEEKEQETLAYLRYLKDNRLFSLLGRFRLNDFQSQTEYLPEARFSWMGQPLLRDRLTYIQDTRLGYLRRRWDDEQQAIGALPDDYRSGRAVTEHEVQYPFHLGVVKLVPFFNLGLSYYEKTISGGHGRTALTAGVRSSATFWHIYNVNNRLWDINRLRHVVTPIVEFFDTFDVNLPSEDVYQFDSADAVDEMRVIRLGLRQRLQTRRLARSVKTAAVGGWYTVDWMRLNLDLDYYPNADQNPYGEHLGPLRIDYSWQASDRIALLSKANLRVESGFDVETFDVGLIVDRSPRASLYLGERYIAESGSNMFIANLNYKLDERWTVGFFGQMDFGLGEVNNYRFVLKRRLHRWIMAFSLEHDAGLDDNSFMITLVPQGFFGGKAGIP